MIVVSTRSLRGTFLCSRFVRSVQQPHLIHKTRYASDSTTGRKTPPQPRMYPERLLIYHSGTGRTVFIGCLKVTTIFVFSFLALIVAPSVWRSEEQPGWVAGAVLLSSATPILLVSYTTAPFVHYIHLRLPVYARRSHDLLMRYARNPPPSAPLDLTTMSLIGRPRITRTTVGDLRPVRRRAGLVTYLRDTALIDTRRPWWMGRAVRAFGVLGNGGRIPEAGVWENVAAAIARR